MKEKVIRVIVATFRVSRSRDDIQLSHIHTELGHQSTQRKSPSYASIASTPICQKSGV